MGEFEFQAPEDLIRLLTTMARNKLASAARREYQQKRDAGRRDNAGEERLREIAGQAETASMIVSSAELLDRARAMLHADESKMAELRQMGRSWDEIAQELGGTSQARRVQFMRAVARITQQLGLGESASES